MIGAAEAGCPEVADGSTSISELLFSIENLVMTCSLPLSKSWKSSWRRLPTARPSRSLTTTGTDTRFTRLLNVTGAS